MDFFERVGETITAKGKDVADKAKDLAEIASLRSQISTCEEVMKKNYLEIEKTLMLLIQRQSVLTIMVPLFFRQRLDTIKTGIQHMRP